MYNNYQAPHANQYQGPPRGGYNHYSGSQRGAHSKGNSMYNIQENLVCFRCQEHGHRARYYPVVSKPAPQAPAPTNQTVQNQPQEN